MKKKLSLVTNKHELNYDNNFGSILAFVKKYWNVGSTKPKNYKELLKKGEDQQMQRDYKSFNGFDTETATCDNLPSQLSPSDVVYADLHCGNKPIETLLSSVYAYAFQIGAKSQELKYKEAFNEKFEFKENLKQFCNTPANQASILLFDSEEINNIINHNSII